MAGPTKSDGGDSRNRMKIVLNLDLGSRISLLQSRNCSQLKFVVCFDYFLGMRSGAR